MLNNLENNFKKKLLVKLDNIYSDLIELFRTVELSCRNEINENGDKVEIKTLSPTRKQSEVSYEIYNEYEKWFKILIFFLKKNSDDVVKEITNLFDIFKTYILFNRVGTNISDDLWKNLFLSESSSLLLAQINLIKKNSETFSIFKDYSANNFIEFSIKFFFSGNNTYEIESQSILGEASSKFILPFDKNELELFILKYCQLRKPNRRGTTPTSIRPFSEFGLKLFESIMNNNIKDLFLSTKQYCFSKGLSLRIKLRFKNTPHLSEIPWEFIYDGCDFIGLSKNYSISRYLDLITPVYQSSVNLPFKILVTISSPDDQISLDVEAEKQNLYNSLESLESLGILKIDFSKDGTLRTLQRMLRNAESIGEPYHIWHYIGHGGFDEIENSSVLIFENDNKLSKKISGFELGTLFSGYPSLKISILNACECARTGIENPLSGVATSLVERGLSAVIAMQFEITDKAALTFSEEFYMALSEGFPIDIALSEARRSIFFLPNYIEWATPVLFMRTSNGKIFNLQNLLSDIIKI